jgi:serine/threonine protein phosphatase PrpC
MLCPLCHTQNRDNAKFCKVCGQLLAVEVVAAGQPEAAEQSETATETQTQGTPSSSPLSEDAASAAVPSELPEDADMATAPAEELSQSETTQAGTPASEQSTIQSEEEAQSGTAQVDSSTNEQGTLAPAETAPAGSSNNEQHTYEAYDVSQVPTQILTPQQMLAFHARRWQQDAERGEHAENYYDDIAEAPTILITPPPSNTEPTSSTVQEASGFDVADAPTIYQPSTYEESASEQVPADDAAEPVTTHDDGTAQVEPAASNVPVPDEKQEQIDAADVSSPQEGTTAIPGKENNVEQSTNTNATEETSEGLIDEQTSSESSSEDFPTLEVGAMIGGRYEVTQVVSDGASEHIYIVSDHQGYQHCWNCASEQNAEGDEFCIDCGAELLNASYILHAYSATAPKSDDAQVLQGTIINTFVEQGSTYVVEQPQATQTAFPNGAHLLAACDSDAGSVRRSEPNEDSTLVLSMTRVHESISSPAGLFVVADGMGGHANGQGASRLTIALLAERVTRELLLTPLQAEKASEPAPTFDDESFKELLRGAIEEANTALCQVNQKEKSDMGSTLTGFMVVGDYAYIFNVGDSRTYMLRDEKLYQLTNDHSLVGQLVAGGLIEPEDVYTHPQRNQIFRSIGDKQNVQVDLFTQQIHPGDVLLSCSDGLWEMVHDPQITEILNHAPDPQVACTQLIEAANANGGEDNISAVLVFVR